MGMSEQSAGNGPHSVIIEERATLTATGVKAVVSYDEQSAQLDTAYGMPNIGGEGLNVSELSVQAGQVKITGQIEFIQYTAKRAQGEHGGFWKRLTR